MNHNIYYVKLHITTMIRKISIVLLSIVVISSYVVYIIKNPVSPLETVQNDDSTISITYSRPFKKDRLIFGKESDSALVPFGKYWRTGANKHTFIKNSQDIEINGKPFLRRIFNFYHPSENEWEVFFNTNINYFGL